MGNEADASQIVERAFRITTGIFVAFVLIVVVFIL